jgi:hypothetical protein
VRHDIEPATRPDVRVSLDSEGPKVRRWVFIGADYGAGNPPHHRDSWLAHRSDLVDAPGGTVGRDAGFQADADTSSNVYAKVYTDVLAGNSDADRYTSSYPLIPRSYRRVE